MSEQVQVSQEAAALVMLAMREAGIDPARAVNSQLPEAKLIREMMNDWVWGRWTREEFVRGVRNMGILNRELRLT